MVQKFASLGVEGAGASCWVSSTLVPVFSTILSLFMLVVEGYQMKLVF